MATTVIVIMNHVRTDSSEKNAPSKTDIKKLGSSTRGKCASNHDCSPLDTMYRLSWDGAMATVTVSPLSQYHPVLCQLQDDLWILCLCGVAVCVCVSALFCIYVCASGYG